MTITQIVQMPNSIKEMYNLSREQAKLVSTLINKELLEYKHVEHSVDGVLYQLLESTLTQMGNPQKIEGS